MNDLEWMSRSFDDHRAHLRGLALRMLGSAGEADAALAEAWSRLGEASAGDVTAWMTSVVAQVCRERLRTRPDHNDDVIDRLEAQFRAATQAGGPDGGGPTQSEVARSVSAALVTVLDRLSPAERLAFVLRNVFQLPYEEIAPMVGLSPEAARQLVQRARERARSSDTGAPAPPRTDPDR